MIVSSLLAVSEKLWFEPFVWMDYRLALLLGIIMPVVLMIWAFAQKNDTIQHLLAIYWRVASLLAITIYIMIAASPVGFVSSLMARVLIPISLWFWVDLNEDLDHQSAMPLRWSFTSWRWAMTIYSLLGALAQAPFLTCALSKSALDTRFCQVWLDPPWLYKEYFHNNTDARMLGLLGFVALLGYVSYLCYFVLVKLGKHGRSALDY
jgi:hypothetical protein